MHPIVTLSRGREQSVLSGHPWIFRNAIAKAPADVPAGSIVDVLTSDGAFLGRGTYNPVPHIAIRLLTTTQQETIDLHFLKQRLQAAMAIRQHAIDFKTTDAFRFINAEGDFLPGLIVDVYGNIAVAQFQTAGMELLKEQILDALEESVQPNSLFERSDVSVREREGLSTTTGLLRGEPPSNTTIIKEHGVSLYVDVVTGEKTGLFLDQREARAAFSRYAKGKTMLDVFASTGGFGVHAAKSGAAHVTIIDRSKDNVALAEKNFSLNKLKAAEHAFVAGDALSLLPYYATERKSYDVIACDPPSFAQQRNDVPSGIKAYTDLAMSLMHLFSTEGFLCMSCRSPLLTLETFVGTLRTAANKTKRRMQILETHGQPADHPASVHVPEGQYLKTVICRVS